MLKFCEAGKSPKSNVGEWRRSLDSTSKCFPGLTRDLDKFPNQRVRPVSVFSVTGRRCKRRPIVDSLMGYAEELQRSQK